MSKKVKERTCGSSRGENIMECMTKFHSYWCPPIPPFHLTQPRLAYSVSSGMKSAFSAHQSMHQRAAN